MLSFSAPTEQLSDITLDATYIDARAFAESAKDPDQAVTWSVRVYSFRLRDILKEGFESQK